MDWCIPFKFNYNCMKLEKIFINLFYLCEHFFSRKFVFLRYAIRWKKKYIWFEQKLVMNGAYISFQIEVLMLDEFYYCFGSNSPIAFNVAAYFFFFFFFIFSEVESFILAVHNLNKTRIRKPFQNCKTFSWFW